MAFTNQAFEVIKNIAGVGEAPTPFVLRPDTEIIWPKNRPYQPHLLLAAVQQKYITQKAITALEGLYKHRYLSAVQLRRLFFTSNDKKRAKDRVAAMESWGLIIKIRFKQGGSLLPLQVYALDRGGAFLLKEYCRRDMDNWRFENTIRSYDYIMRILAANDVYERFLSFSRSLQGTKGDGLHDFAIEPILRLSQRKHHNVTPTAKFTFRRGEREVGFLLEVIRGAESFERLPAKLRNLEEYYETYEQGNRPVLMVLGEHDDQLLRVEENLTVFRLQQVRDFARFTTDYRFSTSPLHESMCKIVNKQLEVTPFKGILKPDQD